MGKIIAKITSDFLVFMFTGHRNCGPTLWIHHPGLRTGKPGSRRSEIKRLSPRPRTRSNAARVGQISCQWEDREQQKPLSVCGHRHGPHLHQIRRGVQKARQTIIGMVKFSVCGADRVLGGDAAWTVCRMGRSGPQRSQSLGSRRCQAQSHRLQGHWP